MYFLLLARKTFQNFDKNLTMYVVHFSLYIVNCTLDCIENIAPWSDK